MVGEGVDRHAVHHHGTTDGGDGGADVQTGALQQPGGEAEADRRVVVAAGEHHLGAGVDEPGDGLGEQLDGVGRRQRPVVDVAGDQHRVDRLGAHRLDQVVDERGLGIEQPHLVERTSQVPVGGMDQAHDTKARRARRQDR
jgi:hypothetical protein